MVMNLLQLKKRLITATTICLLAILCCSNVFANNGDAKIKTNNEAPVDNKETMAKTHPATLAPMLKKSMPSIVSVSGIKQISKNTTPKPGYNEEATNTVNDDTVAFFFGSGIILDAEKGYIITNAHVINNLDEMWVTLNDKRKFEAKTVGIDTASDLALLKIQAPNLQAIQFADSDKVEVGDFVIAIGNPFGLDQTVTSGIVSALSRTDIGRDGYFDLIQTDAAINMGNSGGGLLNLNGELVGINTAILSPPTNGGSIGLGFAIPSNMAKNIYAQLAHTGHVDRGTFGVKVQFVNSDLAEAFGLEKNKGAIINDIMPNSPAAKANLQVGDIIVRVDSKEVQDPIHLRTLMSLIKPKSAAKISILRDRKIIEVPIQISNPRDNYMKGEMLFSGLTGAWLETASPETAAFPGVLIADIDPKSLASKADLQKGDIIVGANKVKTTNLTELQNSVKSNSKYLIMQILRDKTTLFVAVKNQS